MKNPTKQSKNFDNTRLSTYKSCPRKYFISHVLGWRSSGKSAALSFGSAWHEGLDAIWRFAKEDNQDQLLDRAVTAFSVNWEKDGMPAASDILEMGKLKQRTPGTAHEMYYHYIDQRWRMLQEATLVAAEQPFAVPMPGLEDTWYIGRLDKRITYAGENIVLEHKTTSLYATKGGFRPDYIDSWFSSAQVKGYEFASTMNYGDNSGVWVDIALVHAKVHDKFRLVPVKHGKSLILEWLYDAKAWINLIDNDKKAFDNCGELEAGNFPKNEGNCYGKFGRCPFLDICQITHDPTKLPAIPEGYKKEMWEPFDILDMQRLVEESKKE